MLPENLIQSGARKPKGKPIVAKYTEADAFLASYAIVHSGLSDYQKKRIAEEPHGESAQRMSKDVANFYDNPENAAAINDYLSKNPRK